MNVSRRQALLVGGSAAGLLALGYGGYRLFNSSKPLQTDPLLAYVKPMEFWSAVELTDFLSNMDAPRQRLVMASLQKPDDAFNADEVKKQVQWLASNVATYPFKDKVGYHYHNEILKWLASEYHVQGNFIDAAPTFLLERKILDALFVEIWDKLTPEQRTKILDAIDKKGNIKDKAGIALAGGSAALAALSVTAYFAGFAFYTTISTFTAEAVGLLGITLPFAGYAGATTTAAVLTGPVGWTIAGLALLGSTLLLGRANSAKTATFVTQIHLIKVDVLRNSGRLDEVLKDLHL